MSSIQLRTSAAMPPAKYAGPPFRGRPRRPRIREEGENGVGMVATELSTCDGEGGRGRTKAGLRVEFGVLCCRCDLEPDGGSWLLGGASAAESTKRGWLRRADNGGCALGVDTLIGVAI